MSLAAGEMDYQMAERLVLIIMMFVTSLAHGQSTDNSPYEIYSVAKKELSVFEWRLVQINLKLGQTGYFVFFDERVNRFWVDKFIDTHMLSTSPPNILRESLLARINLVAAVIGSEFPEFRGRNEEDLAIKFFTGEAAGREFATYSMGNFSFTDDYYEFRREHGE